MEGTNDLPDEDGPFDEYMKNSLESFFKLGQFLTDDKKETLRLLLLSRNLKGLVDAILIGQHQEGLEVDLNALTLGLMGTIDWIDKEIETLISKEEQEEQKEKEEPTHG